MKRAVQQNGGTKIYVAKEDTSILGFISGTIINCFLPISSINKVGYIEAAYVVESYRNKNIMENLEELLAKYFKKQGMKFIELNVLTANTNGKRFWKNHNYNTFREQMRKQL